MVSEDFCLLLLPVKTLLESILEKWNLGKPKMFAVDHFNKGVLVAPVANISLTLVL